MTEVENIMEEEKEEKEFTLSEAVYLADIKSLYDLCEAIYRERKYYDEKEVKQALKARDKYAEMIAEVVGEERVEKFLYTTPWNVDKETRLPMYLPKPVK